MQASLPMTNNLPKVALCPLWPWLGRQSENWIRTKLAGTVHLERPAFWSEAKWNNKMGSLRPV